MFKLDQWTELMGPDLVVKKIGESDEKTNCAEVGTEVYSDIKVFVQNNDELIEELRNERFLIGEGDTVPALELALRHGSVGDKLLIKSSSRFVFGSAGRPARNCIPCIQPDTDINFEVNILKHISPQQLYESAYDYTIHFVKFRKEAGNRWFYYSDFLRAGRCYSKGAEEASKILYSEPDTENTELLSLYVDCLNNLASCYMNRNDFYKVKEICIKIFEADHKNIKALLKAGKASLALHSYTECEACLNRILDIEPSNDAAHKEFVKLKKAKHEYKKKTKKIEKVMGRNLFDYDDQVSSSSSERETSATDNTTTNTDNNINYKGISPLRKSPIKSSDNQNNQNMIHNTDTVNKLPNSTPKVNITKNTMSVAGQSPSSASTSLPSSTTNISSDHAAVTNNTTTPFPNKAATSASSPPSLLMLATSSLVLVITVVIAYFIYIWEQDQQQGVVGEGNL